MPENFRYLFSRSAATKRNSSKLPSVYPSAIGSSIGSSQFNPASSARQIRDITGTTTDGLYWIQFPNGVAYEVYCLMSSGGGGWMSINTNFGSYSNAIFNASTGSGSANMVGSVTGSAANVFVGPYVTHNQAAQCGNCSGSNCPSRIGINSSIVSEMGITEFRMHGRVSSTANYSSCPYFATPIVTTNVAGTKYSGCAINADMGPFIDVIGPSNSNYIVYAWSACGTPSPFTARVEGLYVR